MTPQEFLQVRDSQQGIIDRAQMTVFAARLLANQSPMPLASNLRPALSGDIVPNAIFWYPAQQPNDKSFWAIVQDPLYYGDAFKAYVAYDGCRYGLSGAYIEGSRS